MRSFPGILSIVLVLCLVEAGPGLSAEQTGPAPQVTSYTIAATLDAPNRLIVGQARLEWRNSTLSAASELRIVTPWNGRRHDRTTWANERRLLHPSGTASEGDASRGFMDLTALHLSTVSGTVDLLPRATPVAPDDGNPDDRTVWVVPLDQPVPPGQTVELELKWNAHIPAFEDGTGAIGPFIFAGQWYPAMGVLSDEGWQAHQTHFGLAGHRDFGSYQVDLRLPSGWLVGATGREAGRQDHGDGSTTHRFRAENVPDFAWSTSPSFVERTDRFAEPGLPPVNIRLLLQKTHLDQVGRQLAATKTALKFYAQANIAYPWSELTVVDTPGLPSEQRLTPMAVARSYPGLLRVETRRVTTLMDPGLERQLVAQVGSQIWGARAGPDHVTDAWLTAGIGTFVTARVMAEAFEPRFVKVERYFGGLIAWPYEDVRWNPTLDGADISSLRRAATADTAATPSWRQHPATLASNLGSRTPLMLTTLERVLGRDMLQSILSAYGARAAFRHPDPEEFFSITNSVSGRDLKWFFDATHRSAVLFDYSIQSVFSVPTDADSIDSTVVVQRLADGVFPVEIRVVFDDGSSVVDRWDGQSSWQALKYRRAARVLSAEVDPDRVLALDINRTNNSWTSHPRARQAASKWAIRWAGWFQHFLLTYAFFV